MSINEYEGILTSLEEIHKKLDKLLASGSNWSTKEHMIEDLKNAEKIVTMSDEEFRKKEITMKEEVECDKDLSGVVLLKETPKAFLAFKENMQVWVAKSHLVGDYIVGNGCDLKVKEGSKWILDKLEWKPFTVVKG